MAESGEPESPGLQEQTIALGKLLKSIAGQDPGGTPTEAAAAAFAAWLAEAGPTSREPSYFVDVVENYIVRENSNQDLWNLFDILENYVEFDEEIIVEGSRTFIGLPLAPGDDRS